VDYRTHGIDRRKLLLVAGSAGVAAAIGRTASAQDAPSGTVRVGVSEDGYRTDERANIGFYPLNTNIFESLVYLTPDYQIEPLLVESGSLWSQTPGVSAFARASPFMMAPRSMRTQ
jgi:hypothetical protein